MKTPLGDFFENEGAREHERNHRLIFEDRTDEAMLAHRERPHLGQAHTLFGERGRIEVKNLTMRDIADCIARGFGQSLQEKDTWTFDELAMVQNALVNIEKMMDIYPANVTVLKQKEL